MWIITAVPGNHCWLRPRLVDSCLGERFRLGWGPSNCDCRVPTPELPALATQQKSRPINWTGCWRWVQSANALLRFDRIRIEFRFQLLVFIHREGSSSSRLVWRGSSALSLGVPSWLTMWVSARRQREKRKHKRKEEKTSTQTICLTFFFLLLRLTLYVMYWILRNHYIKRSGHVCQREPW